MQYVLEPNIHNNISDKPVIIAFTSQSNGDMKRYEKSRGSVIPATIETKSAGISNPFTVFLFSGFAVFIIARTTPRLPKIFVNPKVANLMEGSIAVNLAVLLISE